MKTEWIRVEDRFPMGADFPIIGLYPGNCVTILQGVFGTAGLTHWQPFTPPPLPPIEPEKTAFEEWMLTKLDCETLEEAARQGWNAATEAERKRFAEGVEQIIEEYATRTQSLLNWCNLSTALRKLAKGEG